MPILLAAVAILGLAVGSFLNVVIYRLPRGESLSRPGSHCPACDAAVRARHNVPVLGWLVLRGKCADCNARISPRYPVVEVITAGLFLATTVEVARLHLLAALPAYLFFVAAGIALAAIDLEVMRLPNAIVYPSYAVLAVLLTTASFVTGSFEPLLRAVIGAVSLFVAFLALAIARPGGLAFGDVKVAGVVGAVLGFLSYRAIIVGVFAAVVIGGLLVLLLAQRGERKTHVPFGPAMLAGALVALFASAPIAGAYAHFAHQI